MIRKHDPSTVPSPASNYANAVEVVGDGATRWLFVSGQVGMNAAGELQVGFEAQCRAAFANIGALLEDAGMNFDDVVKLGVFLTRRSDLGDYRRVRDEVVTSRVASSLVVVAGLAIPEWLVEIEAVAAAR